MSGMNNLISSSVKLVSNAGVKKLLLGKCHPCEGVPKAAKVYVKMLDWDPHLNMVLITNH